jgi:cytochrome c peroxidase
MFKTPTLRNVATRSVLFHNGALKSLKDVIHFYNTRDTEPERWYPTVKGVVQKFNDLPALTVKTSTSRYRWMAARAAASLP